MLEKALIPLLRFCESAALRRVSIVQFRTPALYDEVAPVLFKDCVGKEMLASSNTVESAALRRVSIVQFRTPCWGGFQTPPPRIRRPKKSSPKLTTVMHVISGSHRNIDFQSPTGVLGESWGGPRVVFGGSRGVLGALWADIGGSRVLPEGLGGLGGSMATSRGGLGRVMGGFRGVLGALVGRLGVPRHQLRMSGAKFW